MKKWKKISEQTLLTHPFMTIKEDVVELPSGKRSKYIRIDNTHDAAQIIAINDQGRIFVQKEYSYPPDDFLFQFPGGKIEHDEDPKGGAARELAEEASLQGDLALLGWFYTDNRRKTAKFYVYTATNLRTANHAQADEEEDFENYWFTPKTINQMIVEGKIVNYSFLAAWSLFSASTTQPQE